MASSEHKKKPTSAGTVPANIHTSKSIDQDKDDKTSIPQKESKGKTKTKKRNWACVVYPESLPENWIEILNLSGLQVAISPLHDKDVNPDNTIKKPHYHLILIYSGPTSFNVVKQLTDQLNAPIPVPLEAVRGYYRYLTHRDNPEKYQYDEKEIRCLNGFSILDFVELTKTEVLKIKKDLITFIRSRKIRGYGAFVDLVMTELSDNEFDVATGNTFFFDRYISSNRNDQKTDWKQHFRDNPDSLKTLPDEVDL